MKNSFLIVVLAIILFNCKSAKPVTAPVVIQPATDTGCNSMSGRFTIKENFIAFNKEIITTKMACIGYDENSLLSVLLKINRYALEDNVLELSQNDIVLMRLIKK